jgi:hypothetical protein
VGCHHFTVVGLAGGARPTPGRAGARRWRAVARSVGWSGDEWERPTRTRPAGGRCEATEAAGPLTPEVPLRAIGLISALRTSPYCVVTRAQPAARASITSTCHPILPGRAVCRPAVVRRRGALSRNAGWLSARLGAARQGRRGLAAGPPTPRAVTARSPPHPMRCGADLERRVAWFSHLLDSRAPLAKEPNPCPRPRPRPQRTSRSVADDLTNPTLGHTRSRP